MEINAKKRMGTRNIPQTNQQHQGSATLQDLQAPTKRYQTFTSFWYKSDLDTQNLQYNPVPVEDPNGIVWRPEKCHLPKAHLLSYCSTQYQEDLYRPLPSMILIFWSLKVGMTIYLYLNNSLFKDYIKITFGRTRDHPIENL